jgi:HEPN domain-containing protein
MRKKNNALIWLRRAESNLARAAMGQTDKRILYEDLCFDCQQAVEKSLKSLIVFYDFEPVVTHSIPLLLNSIQEQIEISIPETINESAILTDYAVQTRYPGFYEPVTESEYNTALQLATLVFNWVKEKVEGP